MPFQMQIQKRAIARSKSPFEKVYNIKIISKLILYLCQFGSIRAFNYI